MDFWGVTLLLGGLGLFLYGMKLLSEGLEAIAGDKLRNGLEALTKNRFAAVGVGAGVTAVIQSSSATTVMVVGFVNAGLMTLTQAINVGMGANIGTTITAQIVAFKATQLAPLILFAGILVMLFVKNRKYKKIGEIVSGLGILLFGMNVMGEAVMPLRDYEPFIKMLTEFQEPGIGLLAGTVVTAIIQSSSATMGIVQAFAMQGVIGLDSSVYVILGLNIGTCITAILASIGGTKTGKRTAIALLFFNIIGVAIFFVLMQIFPIVDWVKSWTPNDPLRQLANFHTFFNVATTAMLIGFPVVLTKIAYFCIRGEDKRTEGKKLKYITKNTVETPTAAIAQSIQEVIRMTEISATNFKYSVNSVVQRDEKLASEVFEQESVVNYLNHEITDVLSKVSQDEMSEVDSFIVTDLLHAIMDIERISDLATNIAEFTILIKDKKIKLSKKAIEEMEFMSSRVDETLEDVILAMKNKDRSLALKATEIEEEIDELEKKIKKNHVKRLKKGECTPAASTLFSDMITIFERITDHTSNIAKILLRGDLFK